MSTQKHTKGPWGRNIAPAWKYPIIFAGRSTHVAKIITDELPESEQEANACLIAAAPELLSALESMVCLYEIMNARNPYTDSRPLEALAAIAKAEGKA
jgi:hypothetical protein